MTADTPPVDAQPVEPLTAEEATRMTAESAKDSLRRAWFAAHPNQPIPEGRRMVEERFAAIERATLDAARAGDGLDVERLARAIAIQNVGKEHAFRSDGSLYPQDVAVGEELAAIYRNLAALAVEGSER